MKGTVDDSCITCGLCVDLCPEVFEIGSADIAEVKTDPVPPEQEESCRKAAEECPVDAIQIEE